MGGTETLTAVITPSNAINQNVTWTSNNTAVAAVDNNGVVSAVAAGTVTITVTTENGGFTANCAVTVIGPGTHWNFIAGGVRSAFRLSGTPSYRGSDIGFRLVRPQF